MKTLHIKNHTPDGWLLKELYKKFLINDPLWHFVYWQDGWTHKAFIEGENLIVRVNDPKVLAQVRKFLDRPEMIWEEYDFPFCRGKYQLGIKRLSWEARNLDVCLPMLHAMAVARIKFGHSPGMKRFIDHYFHIGANIANFDHADEVLLLSSMLYSRASVVKKWYRGMQEQLYNKKYGH